MVDEMELPFRHFRVAVRGLTRLSPSFLRVTFTGDDLDAFADTGRDQRIKLVLPAPDGGLDHLPAGADWYARWRELPDQRRPPIRTYTVRAVRQSQHEVDVDMVLHGDGGPATRWANRAATDDQIVLIGPNARYPGEPGGVEFRPHRDDAPLLLAGDETAVPAIASILNGLPATARGQALLEVPHASDFLDLTAPPGLTLTWLARDGAAPGTHLVPAVVEATSSLAIAPPAPRQLDDVDVDAAILWEIPDTQATTNGTYAWLAGEAGVIKTLRRHLVGDRGWDRRTVAFMGYWRIGRAETT
ncbi:siderophore-interacting protein [Phytohabitans suffuscus]|uniref:Siderophore-interacting protein n=2 Tax=Phytohabitans suffuscus TaxID=624315 RepID=A0A6F8YPT6_9ACTN|nr:siderophore-interacting protein [Phytohabitans suffuscus]BCB88140.1 siderophore-interacting protein [Phytohabitans suffuscus]